MCFWYSSWDSCNNHSTTFCLKSYLQVSSSGPCNACAVGRTSGFYRQKLGPPCPLPCSSALLQPRGADGAVNPKKCLQKTGWRDKAPATKGQPLSCWRCQGFMLGSARNRGRGSGRMDWGAVAHSMIQNLYS